MTLRRVLACRSLLLLLVRQHEQRLS